MKFSTNKLLYIRRLAFALIIIITAVLQTTKGAVPEISSVRAMLIVPAVVCISMHEKSVPAILFGAFGGILIDMTSSATDGFFAVALAAAGFACSLLITFEMRNNIICAVIMSFCASFLCGLLYWLLFILLKSSDMAAHIYFRYYFPSSFYTAVYTFIFYYLTNWITKVTTPERKRINY